MNKLSCKRWNQVCFPTDLNPQIPPALRPQPPLGPLPTPDDGQRDASGQAVWTAQPAAPLTDVLLLPPTAQSDLGISPLPSFARNGRDCKSAWEIFTFLLNFDGFTKLWGYRSGAWSL